jgi:hypothetical protein
MAKEQVLTTPKHPTQHVWVKDRAGNEYICPIDALKNPKKATKEELAHCVNDAKIAAA